MAGKGIATIDFGAFPGSQEASVVVTGESAILADSAADAFVMASDYTTDHTASDHAYLKIFASFSPGDVVAGSGFTIHARSQYKLQGTFKVRWVWA
jgi:hypothetical protein